MLRIKTKWMLIARSVKKILKILTQKCLEQKNNKLIIQSKWPACGIKKSRFVKEQEKKGLLRNLGITTQWSKIPLLSILFWMQFH